MSLGQVAKSLEVLLARVVLQALRLHHLLALLQKTRILSATVLHGEVLRSSSLSLWSLRHLQTAEVKFSRLTTSNGGVAVLVTP